MMTVETRGADAPIYLDIDRELWNRLDPRDKELRARREAKVGLRDHPQVGDFVIFADGIERRISHVWWNEEYQTSAGGSFYLGEHGASFSGTLYRSVPRKSLTRVEGRRAGSVWFFHHTWHTAGGGVQAEIMFAVWNCDRKAPK